MPTTREYRIVMPVSVEEYRIAQLYMIQKMSASESSGMGDGVEMLKNEPYEDAERKGQYTHKIYHLEGKVPAWAKPFIPRKALFLEEKAWNAYPYCRTVLSSPYFVKLQLVVESMHLPDRGSSENALKSKKEVLNRRVVEQIDIGMDPAEKVIENEDPKIFVSRKTGRGPLAAGWKDTCEPVMCAYKMVTADIPYYLFGKRLETYITQTVQRKLFTESNRKAFCWMDEWVHLTMEDIREMEKATFEKINQARALSHPDGEIEKNIVPIDDKMAAMQLQDVPDEQLAAAQNGEAKQLAQ